MISDENHDWTKPIEDGPSRLGFDTSYITMQGKLLTCVQNNN